MHLNGSDRPRREWQGTMTLVLSVSAILVALSGGWSTRSASIDFHERRLTALETWQAEVRATTHEMDKKLDRVLIEIQGMNKP